jgi:Septum formation
MRSIAARLLAVLATAAALTSCSASGSSEPRTDPTPVLTSPTKPTHTPKPKPPTPPPTHACYRLGYDEVLAPTSDKRAVPCTGRHTAITFFVGSFDPKLAVDGGRVHRIESTVCPRRFAAFVGGTTDTRRLSLLRTVWFAPTLEEAGRGAHWFRCMAIALRDDQHLAVLTGPLQGVLNRPDGRAHYGLCGTAEPGTAGFGQRICAAPHSWKALRTVDFPPGPYPGEDKVRAAGQGPCRDAGREAASNPLSYQWSYQWPTQQQWHDGQTYGVCWAPS